MLVLASVGEVVFENRQTELTGKHVGSVPVLENARAPDPRRVVLVGDSYAFIGLTQILSAVFARVTFIWSAAFDWSQVVEHKADLVLCETAERYMAVLPQA